MEISRPQPSVCDKFGLLKGSEGLTTTKFANLPVCPRAVHAYDKFSAIERWTEDQDPELLAQLRRRAAQRVSSTILEGCPIQVMTL